MKREQAAKYDGMRDRRVSHTASDLPVPGCRCILNAVKTAGPTLKRTDRQTLVSLELGQLR